MCMCMCMCVYNNYVCAYVCLWGGGAYDEYIYIIIYEVVNRIVKPPT